jgi:retinol dehydrogenase 12
VRELASKLDVERHGVIINAVNPGLCYSDLARDVNVFIKLFLGAMRALLARSTEEGARTLVFATTGGVDSHGKYSSDCTFNE